jgi:iron complex outermembrane recepter protein
MKKLCLFVMLLTTCSVLSYAQSPISTISGRVTEYGSDLPLAGANVWIDGTFLATTTNADGFFVLKNVQMTRVTLVVSYVGYSRFSGYVTADSNDSLEVKLKTSAYTTEEIVITASRADAMTPSTQHTVRGTELMELGSGQDLPVLLELTPSVVSSSDAGAGIGYTGFRIRGTDISRINVTINGVPLNDPESHGVFWVNMPDLVSSVDNIQIQRGVGTSSNGAAAFGASVNIQTTKFSDEPYAEINSFAGSFNSFSNNVKFGTGLLQGMWTFDGRLSRTTSDGYIDRAFSDLKSYFFNAGCYREKTIFRFTMLGGYERTYQAWGGVPRDSLETNRTYNPYTYENETDNYGQYHFHFNLMHQFSKKITVNSTAFLIKGAGYYEQYKDDRDLTGYGLSPFTIGADTLTESDLIQQKHLDNMFYGLNASVHYNSMKKTKISAGFAVNRYTNDHFGKIIWMQYAGNVPVNYQWYLNTGKKSDYSAYVKGTYLLTDRLSLYGDLLFRHIEYDMNGLHDDLRDLTQTHGFDFLNPKAGLFYRLNSNNEWYASFAMAGREPSRNDFRDADPGVEIREERLYDYEAGYRFKRKNILLNVNVFYMDYKDQLILTGEINNVGDPVMINVPQSYRAGIESAALLKVGKNIEFEGNIALSRNKISGFTEYIDDWDTWSQVSQYLGETDISFSPSVVSGAVISYMAPKNLKVSLTSKYVGRQYIDNTSSVERSLNPWYVNNLNLSYKIYGFPFNEIEFKLSVINLFNTQYESNAWVYRYIYGGEEYAMDGYFPQAGRHFMAGVRVAF